MPWDAENFAGNVEAFIRTLIGMGRIEDAVRWSASLLVCPRESVSFPGKADLDALGRELAGMRYILNVIPWNETGVGYRPPSSAIQAPIARSKNSGFSTSQPRASSGRR